MLSGLVSDIVEDLPVDAYPGEEPAAVVLEMLTGTIRTALESADPADVVKATELIDEALSRTLEHLQLALGLSRRFHGEAGGRHYG